MKVAGRRRGRWKRLRGIWGRWRDAYSDGASLAVDAVYDRVRICCELEEQSIRQRRGQAEAVEGNRHQRWKFDDRRNREDPDGDVAGWEIFGGREERRNSEPRIQRIGWDE